MLLPSQETSLIEYPCHFPIKVLGVADLNFLPSMTAIAQQFDANFDASTIEQRASKAGNYLGLTLHVHVTSREQLDDLYRTLSSHPMVKVAL
jgi:hypothetical protein